MPAASKSLYLIHGTDEFEVKRAAEQLTQELQPTDPFNFETIDAQVDDVDGALKKISQFQEALLTLPFGGGGKLVWFKNVSFLGDSPQGRNSQVTEKLDALLPELKSLEQGEVKVVISALQTDKRRSFYKAISGIATVKTFDLPDLKKEDPENIINDIAKRLQERGLTPGPGAAERLFDALGVDTRAWEQEIEKLALHHSDASKPLEASEVRMLVPGNRDVVIWDFCDAVISGKTLLALQLLQQLWAQEESDVGIVILLGNQIRQAAFALSMVEAGLASLSSFGKLSLKPEAEALLPRKKSGETTNTYVLGKLAARAATRKKPTQFWRDAVDHVYSCHRQLLTSGSDKRRFVEQLVLAVAA